MNKIDAMYEINSLNEKKIEDESTINQIWIHNSMAGFINTIITILNKNLETEKGIKQTKKMMKNVAVTVEDLKEKIENPKNELKLKNDEIIFLKNKLNKLVEEKDTLNKEKQRKEADMCKQVISIIDEIDNVYKYARQVNDTALVESLEQVYFSIEEKIKKIGLEVIDAKGKFNINIHKCIGTKENTEIESNQIMSVVETGYKLNGKVLRYASVIISK